MEPMLVATGLRKTFTLSRKQQQIEKSNQKVKVAVDDLSFVANKGEIYGLLGPNGAGKTTTLRMLATLIRPDEGDALLDGISVVNNPDAVRSRIGFLTGELKLEDFFTPNYLFDFFSDLHGVDPTVAAALEGVTYTAVEKPTFGSVALPALVKEAAAGDFSVELIGLCTDICVVSNTLLLKAHYPEADITVDASCCAGVTPATHEAALTTMEMCQIRVTR